ncbi:unnamed protein product [Chironomus riparius]|uniref:Uncharacterized protein n=1 Tax=Chironomus riparius TaxID=315576 RepID=A0A9N9WJJ5_9DIPT|nr:unnamed protein product [Chironomus riparius]
MKSFGIVLSIISIICVIGSCYGKNNRYSKSCFVRYLLKTNQIDAKYKKFINDAEVSPNDCEMAVNLTLDAIRTASKEPCIASFLKKKDVAEVLLRKFLMPQLDNGDKQVVIFDDQFTEFRRKIVDISSVVCNNPKIFRPDVAKLMREAKSHKESKARELKCLEIYIKKPANQILTDECKKVVDYVRKDFYGKMDSDMKTSFAAPNDQLLKMECVKEKAEQFKMFERVFFFVVLSTSRDMNDKQINAVAKNADIAINSSQKVIFECMV